MRMSSLLQFCGRRTSSCATSIENGADVERLSQKATVLARVGWALVSHLIIGGHKARRYAELSNGDFIWCHVQCSCSQLMGQSLDICRPRSRIIRCIRIFPLIIGMLSLSLGLPFGCGDDNGPVGPGDPAKIVAINGLYYKGVMGDTIPDTVLQFAVADKNDNYLPNQQIQLYLVEGDGHLPPKSITTDSSGTAGFPYVFNGSLGHAVIRLIAPDIDTLDILLRANTLILGSGGQAQYVLLTDTYAEVRGFNGPPQSIDIDTVKWKVFANYEDSLGVVVLIDDVNHNEDADEFEDVQGIGVDNVYNGTTLDSIPIGIGSPFADVRTMYSDPNKIELRTDDEGPYLWICYKNHKTVFIGGLDPDTTIIEIDLYDTLICR